MVAELVSTYHDDEILITGHHPVSPELAAEIKARAHIRDVPRACWCPWGYDYVACFWHRKRWIRGCPWHLYRPHT